MKVFDNLAFGLKLSGMPKPQIRERVMDAAKMLEMEHLLDRYPKQLSGGQAQRVAVGRAIVKRPEVFLFDEPLSNLDAKLRIDMRMHITKLHQQIGATMIYVTHDQVEAMTLADKIVVLENGIVQQIGAPIEIYKKPANKFVAGFIGSPKMNFLDVTVKEVSGSGVIVESPTIPAVKVAATGFSAGEKAVLGVRPQYLRSINEALGGTVKGTISLVERLGSETIVSFQTVSDERALATIPHDEIFEPGGAIEFCFDPKSAHLFPAD